MIAWTPTITEMSSATTTVG